MGLENLGIKILIFFYLLFIFKNLFINIYLYYYT